jgi:hypothetical protein
MVFLNRGYLRREHDQPVFTYYGLIAILDRIKVIQGLFKPASHAF